MVTSALLESVCTLSVTDKLALIEAISQMLQSELQNKTHVNGVAKKSVTVPELASVKPKSRSIQELLAEAANRPKPTPDKMIRLGMFQGRIPTDEELFKAAEWHPTDEELASV
ncbi:MAG: hypothetical protein DYG89_12345 [Caldilinea sp. CFX5]|nr:hypothetical protein [Caldilinea sp. CFX5]